MKRFFSLLILMFLLLTTDYGLRTANAAIPHLINYQGRLTDANGAPLKENSCKITFRIYNAEKEGTLLWQGTYENVLLTKGIFSILLGDINDTGFDFANLAFDKPYFLEIKVATDEPMTPRQKITSSGYAVRAERAEEANNADTVGNVGVNVTPTANKILPLDNNAKIPLNAVGLKTYDSGWFAIASNHSYVKNHNLGTTKVLVSIYFSTSPDGIVNCYPSEAMEENTGLGFSVLTTSTITITTGRSFCQSGIGIVWGQGPASGYARIIMIALE